MLCDQHFFYNTKNPKKHLFMFLSMYHLIKKYPFIGLLETNHCLQPRQHLFYWFQMHQCWLGIWLQHEAGLKFLGVVSICFVLCDRGEPRVDIFVALLLVCGLLQRFSMLHHHWYWKYYYSLCDAANKLSLKLLSILIMCMNHITYQIRNNSHSHT